MEASLIAEVVNGENRAAPSLRQAVILGFQQHGDHRRMPVVHVKNPGLKTNHWKRLNDGPREVGVLLSLEIAAAVYGMTEVMLVVDEVNRDALPVELFDSHILGSPADVHAEADQMTHAFPVPVFDDAMKRQHQPGIESQPFHLSRQRSDHIRQPSRFGKRRAFRPDHQNRGRSLHFFFSQSFLQCAVHFKPFS
ncbi:MAG: hypothetical protein BWX45_00301 [Deltaproteobacteria bacterium ADurb.Bin002]|nr:MAG: hypothetical protein BWX45_00301 [Deltaproteobacteria bacterium ADurb.Bin002]